MRASIPMLLIPWLLALNAPEEPFPRSIDRFDLVGLDAGSVSIQGEEFRLEGEPDGYLATRTRYRDFTLTFECRYEQTSGRPAAPPLRGNSGVLLFIQPPHKVWPRCVQVQLAQEDPGHLFGMAGAEVEARVDRVAQRKAWKPGGEWNSLRIQSRGGSVVCEVNGIEVARGEVADTEPGSVGWQSEGAPIRFRKVRIVPGAR